MFSITIAITITLAIAIILAIFTITIIIAILSFLKIQTVNGDTEVRQFVVFHKLIDQNKLCLTGIISTAYVYQTNQLCDLSAKVSVTIPTGAVSRIT